MVFQASNLLRSATAAARAEGIVTGGKWEVLFWRCGLEQDLWDITEDQDLPAWNQAVSLNVLMPAAIGLASDTCSYVT